MLGVQTPKKTENPTKTYKDKVLKNEASEKDSALIETHNNVAYVITNTNNVKPAISVI